MTNPVRLCEIYIETNLAIFFEGREPSSAKCRRDPASNCGSLPHIEDLLQISAEFERFVSHSFNRVRRLPHVDDAHGHG
jgi:hypothetical protein